MRLSSAVHKSLWWTSLRIPMPRTARHPKRYLDVEELLGRGINVYTTINIQHIESLNDVIAQITHVRVRETCPGHGFDRADAVELVDLTPDDLIARLKEGKVYVPKQAERALEALFLARQSDGPARACVAPHRRARRRAAAHGDASQRDLRTLGGGRAVVVCVSEDPRSAGLVRYAKRFADRLHAPWTALYVESQRSLELTEEERDRIADTLRLAETLGGEAVTVPAPAGEWPRTSLPMRKPTT